MNYPTKTDPVVMDEAAYDRQCERNRIRKERCNDAAQEEYDNEELNSMILEWLEDEPHAAAQIALAVIYGIDNDDMELYLSRESISIRDVRSTIDAVIAARAEDMYDSGENY